MTLPSFHDHHSPPPTFASRYLQAYIGFLKIHTWPQSIVKTQGIQDASPSARWQKLNLNACPKPEPIQRPVHARWHATPYLPNGLNIFVHNPPVSPYQHRREDAVPPAYRAAPNACLNTPFIRKSIQCFLY
ncbi:hypothetical protein MVEN_02593200 [Mycena venus]|uniref:Uncharacterized protein n=1 Tax=Mycena venus TaxID=2733690 RepID=A0A8H6U1E2_9AGAR|nr:hypothetical protein MVEN_02593200 [Mycena venus]